MSKITRYDGNVAPFASNAQAGELFDFGSSVDQNTDLTSLVNANYLRGWGIVGPSQFPPLEWFNAQAFTAGQFISYLHQMGVPEWNSTQEYPTEGAQTVHNLSLWTRGPDWVLGDEPGVADSTRWAKGINTSDLGTGATEVPTNADVDVRVAPIEGGLSLLEFQSNKSITINFASDADLTLTADQNKYGQIKLTDTLGLLTTNREIIVDTSERFILIVNSTQEDLRVKTTAGTGFTVQSGRSAGLRCDGINILTSTNCTEMIVPVGNYSSGTYIYPDGHTQTDYETIEFFGGVSIDDSRTSTTLDQECINNSANTWTVEIPMGTSISTINTRISHTSLNSFEITGTTGGGRLKYVIGKLKEGVTS